MAAIAMNGQYMASTEVSDESVATCVQYEAGERYTFQLEVIQHPQRARACGSGAKSSADRRPVDPPPVVQLRVFKGANAEHDVTLSYLRSFFIFVSLENSKKSEPRPANAAPLPLPVLTGTNVCSVNYLERPEKAGFFIFPDLSVRHEGDYRMVFALYQEFDPNSEVDPGFRNTGVVQNQNQNGPYLKQLATVRSNPFNVFSAKKFPGLMESTVLSRAFAEQGVRVRIRRDVRMRRRGKNDADHGDEEPAPVPGEIAPQPKVEDIERARSHSIASQALSRRPSMEQVGQGFTTAQRSPMTPHTPVSGFGEAPTWAPPAPVVAHQTAFMHPPAAPAGYQQAPYQPHYPAHSQGFAPPPQHYGQVSHSKHNSIEIPQPPTGPSQYTPNYMAPAAQYNHAQQPMSPYGPGPYNRNSMAQAHGLQPINTTHQMQHAEVSPNAGYANAPMQSPVREMYEYPRQQVQRSQPQMHQPQPQQFVNFPTIHPPRLEHQPQPTGATKRTFSASFDSGHLDARLQRGERPASPAIDAHRFGSMSHGIAPAGAEEDMDQEAWAISQMQMSYRRADGTLQRRLPKDH